MEAASALKNKIKILDNTTLSPLKKHMDAYTKHAGQPDNEAFDYILQVSIMMYVNFYVFIHHSNC